MVRGEILVLMGFLCGVCFYGISEIFMVRRLFEEDKEISRKSTRLRKGHHYIFP